MKNQNITDGQTDRKNQNAADRLRITKSNNSKRIGSSLYSFHINVHLVNMVVFAKFYEIPSWPLAGPIQDIEKPKPLRQTNGWTM